MVSLYEFGQHSDSYSRDVIISDLMSKLAYLIKIILWKSDWKKIVIPFLFAVEKSGQKYWQAALLERNDSNLIKVTSYSYLVNYDKHIELFFRCIEKICGQQFTLESLPLVKLILPKGNSPIVDSGANLCKFLLDASSADFQKLRADFRTYYIDKYCNDVEELRLPVNTNMGHLTSILKHFAFPYNHDSSPEPLLHTKDRSFCYAKIAWTLVKLIVRKVDVLGNTYCSFLINTKI